MRVEANRRAELIDWLDDGLRGGRRGRLEAEYPISLSVNAIDTHRVIYDGDRPLSHAMYQIVTARAPTPVRVGLIGLVYTDEAARGHGLARRCIESCCKALEAEGAEIALLWSDKPDFYARLGFRPFGEETRWWVDVDLCRRARRTLESRSDSPELVLDTPQSEDWTELDELYGNKRFRVDRKPGALQMLAAAPQAICVVARCEGRVIGYAALGRGDDFVGVIHEWAGSPRAVLACFEGMCAEWGPLLVQAGPEPGALASALNLVGVRVAKDDFALARVLHSQSPPSSSLYLWGFDSI